MSRLDEFRFARWFNGLNRTVQIALAICLVISLNLIAASVFTRVDITENHRFSLSPETLAYLRGLGEPVKIIVTRPHESSPAASRQVFDHIENLLREYDFAGRRDGKRMVEVEFINVYRQTDRAEELVKKFGIQPERENAIIVSRGERFREILGPELYRVDRRGRNLFRGEEAFTSAILEVVQETPLRLYFTGGHGEMQPESTDALRGLSRAIGFLKQRNFAWDTLDLIRQPEVPEDAGAVIIAGPQTAFLPAEVEKLRNYLNQRNGRIIVFLDPARDHGLDELFYQWGVLSDDMLVLDPSENFVAAGGDMLVRRFAEHPITQLLIDTQQQVLFGLSRPVRPDPGAPLDGRIGVTPLMASSPEAWGERNYQRDAAHRFDPKTDLEGPVPLAVVSERSAASGIGLDLPGGRLVVFGNAVFISNNRFNTAANRILFHNLLNWSFNRENLLSISPREITEYQLTVSRGQLGDISLQLLWVPGGLAALGLMVHLFRRR